MTKCIALKRFSSNGISACYLHTLRETGENKHKAFSMLKKCCEKEFPLLTLPNLSGLQALVLVKHMEECLLSPVSETG
jgi:hypothetical protein